MTQYHQKKIAMINDLSGYGRCSITAALPVLAALKIQCCPVPTSVLSNHTGFPVYFFDDYTDKMEPYIEKWKELGLSFDGIVSGFLGSERQIQIVKDMITEFKKPETKVIVDPIMGDHGETYATYTETMCRKMRELAEMADIFPIFARRIRFQKGLSFTILCVAFGKAVGSLIYYYNGWLP